MKMNIKLDNIDSELMFKTFDVKIGKQKIKTPEKSSYTGNCVSSVNEIYRRFTLNSPRTIRLEDIVNSDTYETTFNNSVKRDLRDNLNIFIVDYADGTIPNQKILEALSDTQYTYSDIVVTPLLSAFFREDGYTGDELLNNFMAVTNRYIEIVETLNNKDIMGVIPLKAPRLFIDEIFDNYFDQDITSFVIDFGGKAADSNEPKIRNIMRHINESGIIEESILYGVNSSEGRFMKEATEIPAKDFVATGFGIDILGLNHVQPRMPTYRWKEIAAKRRTFRLFDSGTYGYYKVNETDVFGRGISGKTGVTKYNNTEQCKEMNKIRTFLSEDSTIEPYFSSKLHVTDKLIDKIKKLRRHTFR